MIGPASFPRRRSRFFLLFAPWFPPFHMVPPRRDIPPMASPPNCTRPGQAHREFLPDTVFFMSRCRVFPPGYIVYRRARETRSRPQEMEKHLDEQLRPFLSFSWIIPLAFDCFFRISYSFSLPRAVSRRRHRSKARRTFLFSVTCGEFGPL